MTKMSDAERQILFNKTIEEFKSLAFAAAEEEDKKKKDLEMSEEEEKKKKEKEKEDEDKEFSARVGKCFASSETVKSIEERMNKMEDAMRDVVEMMKRKG